MSNRNDLDRTATLENENSGSVELTVDTFGQEMRVGLYVPAYKEDGVVKTPSQSIQFASEEWDFLVAEVERCRQARKIFQLPA